MTDLNTLLSVFENQTRREILKRLIEGEQYTLSLSRQLGLSQQAIMKNIEFLEKCNVIEFVGKEKSDLGPPRKMYRVGDNMVISIYLTENFFEIRSESLDKYYNEKLNTESVKTDNLKIFLENIEKELEELNKRRNELLYLKNKVLSLLKYH